MGASNEWQTVYLTEKGWVKGGYKLDHGETQEDIQPEGAVLVARRHVTVGALAVASSVNVDESRSNLIEDTNKITLLLSKYGEPSFFV